ncbi:MAG: class I adenylate-forming enzyme family protein [Actinomycetota bacterium]
MTVRDRFELVRAKDLTLGTLLERLATVYGGHPLVEEAGGGLKLTYAEAADMVARLAGAITERISPGDRVVIATPNGYALLLGCLAASRAGAVSVPVNPKMREEEIDHVIFDSGAELVIRDLDEVKEGEPLDAVAADPGDTAVLFYTSGTTGKPKGAKLTHRSLVGGVGAYAAAVPLQWLRQECVTGMPVAHVAGFSVLVQMAALGVPVYLLTKFRPDDALDAIEQRRATMFVGVPAMYRMMLEAGAEQRDLRSVRMWSSGADVMPDELAQSFQRMGAAVTLPFMGRPVGRAGFVDGYGMVELGGGVAVRVFPPGLPTRGGLVRPLRGHKLKVVDDRGNPVERGEVGELVVKGRGVMQGYHGKDEETAETLTEDGWLRTGDLARERRFGFIEFAGRKKDVIKHGGYSVFAAEVEAVLNDHPAVVESAVLGIDDARKGEIPVAVVRLSDGASLEEDELIAFAKERLSDYKVPQRVKTVDELPHTGTDKVKKTELKPLFS